MHTSCRSWHIPTKHFQRFYGQQQTAIRFRYERAYLIFCHTAGLYRWLYSSSSSNRFHIESTVSPSKKRDAGGKKRRCGSVVTTPFPMGLIETLDSSKIGVTDTCENGALVSILSWKNRPRSGKGGRNPAVCSMRIFSSCFQYHFYVCTTKSDQSVARNILRLPELAYNTRRRHTHTL